MAPVSEKNKEFRLRWYAIGLMYAWTALMGLSLCWNIYIQNQDNLDQAITLARSHFDKDLLFRRWAAGHGGVYVPASSQNPPNPYLSNLPERDLLTPSGRQLTLVNPAYMTRQVYELAAQLGQIKGHITSLKPVRPENAPDPWEIEALLAIEKGTPEVSGVVDLGGEKFLRLMRPLITEKGCLPCHAAQKYKEGDIRGGISVTVPLASIWAGSQHHLKVLWWGHGAIWALGMVTINLGAWQLRRKIRDSTQIKEALRASEEKYRMLVTNLPAIVFKGYPDYSADFYDNKIQELTGYPKEAFKTPGKWSELIVEEDRETSKSCLLAALRTKQTCLREYRIRDSSGHIHWIQTREQIIRDPNGRIDHIDGMLFDVTREKEMELALLENQQHLEIIMDSIRAGVVMIDAATFRIVEVNAYAVELIGLPKERVIGEVCHKFFFHVEKGKCPLHQKTKLDLSECTLTTSTGKNIPLFKTVVPLTKLGHSYFLESFIDLTEQKQVEEALQQTNSKLHQLVYEYSQRNREADLLSKMGEMLQACLASEEVYPIMSRFAQELFPGWSGGLFVLNSSKNLLEAASTWGEDLEGERLFLPENCWAIRRGRPNLAASSSLTPRCRHLSGHQGLTFLCVPLLAQGETLGMLHLQAPQGIGQADDFAAEISDGMPEAMQQLAATLADHVALALANLKLRETLRLQAIRDPLTGLYNRRYLEETLDREFHRVQRKGAPLGIMMLDLDHFKQFNDSFGHEAGDALLNAVGHYLKTHVRTEDIACRYGGEEFTLILPEAVLSAILQRAEEIRQGVQQLQVRHQKQLLGGVTVSIGVAVYPDHAAASHVLLYAADAALYRAKKAGRNQVAVAEALEAIAAPDPIPLKDTATG